MSEEDRVQKIMRDIADGNSSARKLKYDKNTKTLRPSSSYDDPDDVIPLTQQDMNLYYEENSEIITISGEILHVAHNLKCSYEVSFVSMDEGTVFSLLKSEELKSDVPGAIQIVDDLEDIDVTNFGENSDVIRIFAKKMELNEKPEDTNFTRKNQWQVSGYIFKNGSWKLVPVKIVPVREDLFSRFGGILETDKLSCKRVLIIGLGSGGSAISIGLVQSGIMKLDIVDHDRFEVGNVARHVAGISQVGRYKVDIMEDLIHEKNPFAEVRKIKEKVCWENKESFRQYVKDSDIVICATDDRTSKRIMNKLCIEEGKVLIIAGAFRRAYGGQVLRVRPNESLCFQCFIDSLPQQAQDQEISSIEQAQGLAYTDCPVPIEPGLATDIAPINQMVVKLVIQELLRGTDTTWRFLDEDLVASLYLWLNRREQGTDYAKLEPLEFNIDGMSILRWYGIDIPQNSACPVCGDFIGEMSKTHGISIPSKKVQ